MLLTNNMLRHVRYAKNSNVDAEETTKKVQHTVPYKVGGKVVFFG